MEKLASLRNFAFFISFVIYMANAAPADKKATVKQEYFKITLDMYSGREGPTWTLNVSSIDNNVQNVIKRLRSLDMHHDGHAGHNAHAAPGLKTAVKERNGYSKLEVDHFFGDGKFHKMVIERCSDPSFEWEIISKTSPIRLLKDSTLMMLFEILRKCLIESRNLQKAKKTAGSAQQTTKKTTTQHTHNDGHVH